MKLSPAQQKYLTAVAEKDRYHAEFIQPVHEANAYLLVGDVSDEALDQYCAAVEPVEDSAEYRAVIARVKEADEALFAWAIAKLGATEGSEVLRNPRYRAKARQLILKMK